MKRRQVRRCEVEGCARPMRVVVIVTPPKSLADVTVFRLCAADAVYEVRRFAGTGYRLNARTLPAA